jgi:hypothetical protein
MLNELETPALTDPSTNYAALIHVILDKWLELRGRLSPDLQDYMLKFTRDTSAGMSFDSSNPSRPLGAIIAQLKLWKLSRL